MLHPVVSFPNWHACAEVGLVAWVQFLVVLQHAPHAVVYGNKNGWPHYMVTMTCCRLYSEEHRESRTGTKWREKDSSFILPYFCTRTAHRKCVLSITASFQIDNYKKSHSSKQLDWLPCVRVSLGTRLATQWDAFPDHRHYFPPPLSPDHEWGGSRQRGYPLPHQPTDLL